MAVGSTSGYASQNVSELTVGHSHGPRDPSRFVDPFDP